MRIQVLASSRETNGAYSVAQFTVPSGGMGALPHDPGMTMEGFYVLSGRLSVLRGNEWTEAAPGTLISAAPGAIQGFRNTAASPPYSWVLRLPAEWKNSCRICST